MLITPYVVKRSEDGAYVARPGNDRSYTRDLRKAALFPNARAADAARCPGNEYAAPLAAEFEDPSATKVWFSP